MLSLLLGLALQAPAPIHLAELLHEAREKNPELRAALAEARSANASIAPAGALDDPMLMLQLWNGPVDFSSVPLMLQLSETFPLGGKLARRHDAAEADWRESRAGAAAKARDIEQEVATAYFGLFMLDRTIAVDRELESIVASMSEAAEARISSGKGEIVDQLKAEAERLKLQADEETAGAERISVSARLATLLNRDPGEPLGQTGIPELLASLPPEQALRERALDLRPELKAADAAIDAAEAQRRLAEAARVPDLGLSAAEMHAFGAPPGQQDFLFLGVQGNLPVFEGNKTRPKIEAAAAHADAMREMAQALRNQVLAEVADAYAHVAAEEHLVHLHHRLIPLTRQALDSSIAGYAAGRLDFLTVLDSARELQMHELELAMHLGAYEQGLAHLEHAVGTDLGLVTHAEGGRMEAH
ncbi:MAG: TolC family protein [Myxococcales bacterium]